MERREAPGLPRKRPARHGTPTALKRLGSRKLGVQAGRSQGWPKGADRKAPWAPPGAPSLSYGEGRKTGRRAHLGVRKQSPGRAERWLNDQNLSVIPGRERKRANPESSSGKS